MQRMPLRTTANEKSPYTFRAMQRVCSKRSVIYLNIVKPNRNFPGSLHQIHMNARPGLSCRTSK